MRGGPALVVAEEGKRLDAKQVDAILKEVLQTIDRSRGQLLAIAEDARQQFQEVSLELARVKEEAARQVDAVDRLDREDRQARARLLEVSQDLSRHTQEEIRAAYDEAREARVRLQVAREREAMLRRERNALEVRLKRLRETVRRAEDLIDSVGMAFQILSGRLRDVAARVEDLQKRGQLAISIIRAQEEERRRVARDIHDGPAQTLANLSFRLEVCQKLMEGDLEQARAELEVMKAQLRESLQEVRRIIFDLRPLALDDLGLTAALRAYLDRFAARGLKTTFQVLGAERRLPPSVEVTLFRLVQEAANNVWKHARAGTLAVKVEFLDDRVRAVVEDDGVGFDVEAAMAGDGEQFGLLGMRERVALLDGTLEVTSRKGQGSRVAFTVPVEE